MIAQSPTMGVQMLTRRLVLTAAGTLAAPGLIRAQSTSAPLQIGEINSYTAQPAFTLPYKNGWQLALDEINAAGGVLGRKLEVVSRDDAGKPARRHPHRRRTRSTTPRSTSWPAPSSPTSASPSATSPSKTKSPVTSPANPSPTQLIWDKGQPLHLPPPPRHLRCRPTCSSRKPPSSPPSAGSPSPPTTNTANPP